MTDEEAFVAKEDIISSVEDLVESGHFTLEDVVENINDRLCHLVPE